MAEKLDDVLELIELLDEPCELTTFHPVLGGLSGRMVVVKQGQKKVHE